jgi:WD40 repeat protein
MFAVTDTGGKVWIGKDDGKGAELIHGLGGTFVDFSPDGGFLGLVNFETPQTYAVIWDVEAAREVARFHLDDGEIRWRPRFGGDGRLMTGTSKGVLAWDIETGNYEILADADVYGFISNEDGRQLLVTELGEGGLWGDPEGPVFVFDLDAGVTTHLETHGTQVWGGAVNRDGTVVATGGPSGIIRVGPVTGEEPHLLFRHDGAVQLLAFDPLGRWIASAGADNTIRIWPMPDLSKPPLHTLPRSELITKLETLTNIRLVRDAESSTGWKLDHVPFKGWGTAPTW